MAEAVVSRAANLRIPDTPGLGALAGSTGYKPIGLDSNNLYIAIILMSDDSVYMCPNYGWLEWSGTGLVHGGKWPICMIGGLESFSGTDAYGEHDLSTEWILQDITHYTSTYAYYYFGGPNNDWWFDLPKKGSTLSSSWDSYKCKAKFTEWSTVEAGNLRKRKYHIAFPAHNGVGDVNLMKYYSHEIIFESDIFDPDYYPGEIYTKDSWSKADSCNRDNGYFKRYTKNNLMIDRKNRSNDSTNSTVFLYKNSGWKEIAPKIGNE